MSHLDPFSHLSPNVIRLTQGSADQLLRSVRPLDLLSSLREGPLRVKDLTALRCPAYARLLHPLQVRPADPHGSLYSSWSAVLGETPKVGTSSRALLEKRVTAGRAFLDDAEPLIGTLSPEATVELATLISAHRCGSGRWLLYYWEGLGVMHPSEGSLVYSALPETMRQLYPFHGSWFASPTLWWSKTRRWVVATHPDAASTYLGGPVSLIRSVVSNSTLEAEVASEETVVDEWPGVQPGPVERSRSE